MNFTGGIFRREDNEPRGGKRVATGQTDATFVSNNSLNPLFFLEILESVRANLPLRIDEKVGTQPQFLVACTRLYKMQYRSVGLSVDRSVRRSVGPSVRRSVGPSVRRRAETSRQTTYFVHTLYPLPEGRRDRRRDQRTDGPTDRRTDKP